MNIPDYPKLPLRNSPLIKVVGGIQFPSLDFTQEEFKLFQDGVAREGYTERQTERRSWLQIEEGQPQLRNEVLSCFVSEDGTWWIRLGKSSLDLEVRKEFTDITPLPDRFSPILSLAGTVFKLAKISRLGLRYVNHIRLPGRQLDTIDQWKGLIRDDLLGFLVSGFLDESESVDFTTHEFRVLTQHGALSVRHGLQKEPMAFLLDMDYADATSRDFNSELVRERLLTYDCALHNFFSWSVRADLEGPLYPYLRGGE